jgi:hypothetical protein
MSGYQRPQKDEVRSSTCLTLRSLAPSPYRSILTVPSREALCVREMKRKGLLSPSTCQQWIENDTKKRRYLELESAKYPNVSLHFNDLEDHILTQPVDLVNADMESTLTERLGLWFQNNVAPKFIPGGDIVLTVTKWARNNPLHAWLLENLNESIIADAVCDLRVRARTDDDAVVIPLAMLHCALQMSVERITIFDYGDHRHTKMASLVLQNVHCGEVTNWPTFSELIDTCAHERARVSSRIYRSAEILEIIQSNLAAEFKFAEQDGDHWHVYMSKIKGIITQIGGEYDSLEQIAHQFQIEI